MNNGRKNITLSFDRNWSWPCTRPRGIKLLASPDLGRRMRSKEAGKLEGNTDNVVNTLREGDEEEHQSDNQSSMRTKDPPKRGG